MPKEPPDLDQDRRPAPPWTVDVDDLADKLEQLLAEPPEDHEERRRLAWLREKLGVGSSGTVGTLAPPTIRFAAGRAERAQLRRRAVRGMVAVVLNRFRAHGDPEAVCRSYKPSLTTALGAWWDRQFTGTEDRHPPP